MREFEAEEIVMCKIWRKRNTIPASSKQECISFLKSHYRWYQHQYRRFLRYNFLAQLTLISSSAATSIILALKLDDQNVQFKRAAIILPVVTTVVSSILSQLKLRDTANLRELGRIEASDLINKALSLEDTGPETEAACLALKQAAVQLERDQARRFFAFHSRQSENPN